MDIEALPTPETSTAVLLSGLFEQLHRELVARELTTVGISFPDAQAGTGLGSRLRLHGPQEALRSLAEMSWLARVRDYYRIEAVRAVPADHALRLVRRLQPNLSASKVRRLLARGSVTETRAAELLDTCRSLDAPFVQIRSSSSGQRFRLFFEQVPTTVPIGASSTFNGYGFGGAVPWF